MTPNRKAALTAVTGRWPLLQHSFYQRWTQGTLTAGELRYYSDQYRHLVVALPQWLSAAAATHPTRTEELSAHAREEAAHIALWDHFREAVGSVGAGAAANAATTQLIATGQDLADEGLGTAAAWALEAQAPEVSRAKADGLARHHGIERGPGAAYFELHSRMDVRHAEELEDAMAELPARLQGREAGAADAVLGGLWKVLTSAEQTA